MGIILDILGVLFGLFLLIGIPLAIFAGGRKAWRQVPTTKHVTKAIRDSKDGSGS
jgi:hypothetical protein